MLKRRPFLSMLICSAAVLLAVSCNGNGGSSDSYGAVYSPGGGSGSGQVQSDTVSAMDILNYSNADDMGTVVAILLGGGGGAVADETQTQTVTLSADAIGLPSDGTATLVIQGGGVDVSVTATAGADGSVTFEIPAITTGSEITVSLSVKNSAGTLLYSGSSTERLTGDNLSINLTLHRHFWTLPASISLSASPDGFVYDNTKLNETTTLSISGLEDAPAGVTYEWQLDSSPLSDSGPTLTRTWNDLIGPTAPSDELTKTFTVTVSYTDEAGEAKTASASTDVIIGPPVIIPAFTVQIIANSKNGENSSGTNYAFYSTYGGSFTFKVVEAESYFPAGTSFSWSISKTGGGTYEFTGMSVTKTLENLGLTTAGVSASWTVTCTASNARAAAPVTGGGDSSMSGRALKLPSITIQKTSVTGCAPNDNTTFSGDTYAFEDASSGSFTLTAVITSGTAVTGMKYNWSITGSSFSYDSTASNTCTVNLSDLSGFASHVNAAGSWTVKCELTYTGLSDKSASTTLSAFMLKIPDFEISVKPGTGLNEASGSTAASRVFLVGTTDLSKTLTFTATKKAGEPDFPEGTTFTWSSTAATSNEVSVPLSAYCTTVPSGHTSYPETCQASCAGISSDSKGASFALKPRIRLSAPTGLTLGLPYVTGGAGSVSVGASNQFTFPSGTDIANVRVPLSWTAPSVPAGKKFKFEIYVGTNSLPAVTGNFGTNPGASCSSTLGGADETGGWGPHTITVVTALDPFDPEYESSDQSAQVTLTLTLAP